MLPEMKGKMRLTTTSTGSVHLGTECAQLALPKMKEKCA